MNALLSSTSQWYDHFRGALYPLNLDRHDPANQGKKKVRALVQIAAEYIVKDSTMTKLAVQVLPQELCVVLMQQALEANRDRSVHVLLTMWPHNTLSLKLFAPNIFSDLRLLHDNVAVTQAAKQGLRYTTCIAHNFLEMLKGKSTSCLKYIDMTGYPTAEVITYFLATHIMLAHNEARQNVMIQKYENAIRQLPEEDIPNPREKFTAERTMPDDHFVVKLDMFLTSDRAVYEVCKALKVSSFIESTLKIYVEKLDVTCLGEQKIKILLEQLNTQHLHGLRLKYNSISAENFISLCPVMATFTLISTLDLSCNCINIYQNDTACDHMATLFASLPLLVRLDLSNNRLKTKVRRVLAQVVKPLQFLRLAGCGLTSNDVGYLAESHHVQGLRELDISENGLWNAMGPLLNLFRNMKQQLCVLEMEDAGLTDDYMESFITASSLKQLSGLVYLNLSGNSLREATLSMLCEDAAGVVGLQYLHLSYPKECYILDYSEDQDRFKADTTHRLEEVIVKERTRCKLTTVPKLVLSNLDQEMETV